jgi:outer membrane protein TolC
MSLTINTIMKNRTVTALLILMLSTQAVSSQKKWTLEDCITYAVANNIQIQRQKLQTENERVNLTKSMMDVLPDLNLQSNARIGFGRSIDPVTNLITFKQNISNSYSVSSNLALFNGFTTLNTISANKFMLKAGIEAEKVATNTLVVNILGAYYQVVYAKGLEDAAKMQLDLSEKQLFRIQKYVETGREALSMQYEMESRVSEDRLSYTIAENSTSQALTTLKQMLQLEPGADFELAIPEMKKLLITDASFDTDSIYNIASEALPRLKAINYELKAAGKQVSSARGALFPSLSAGGGIFTGYYKVVSEGVVGQDPFKDQIKNNNSQAIYMTLNIPIFNNYTTGRNIKLAKIREKDTELRLMTEKNALYAEIENACLDYNRGKDEYASAVSNYEFNRKSFEVVEKKFESGLVDVTDFSAASTRLFRAETEALRTSLQLLIRRLTLHFYCTGEYENIFNYYSYKQ